jgi:hypothetical protein
MRLDSMATNSILDHPLRPAAYRSGPSPLRCDPGREVFCALLKIGLLILVGLVALWVIFMVAVAVAVGAHKQRVVDNERRDLAVESVALLDRPGGHATASCWTGSTIQLMVEVRSGQAAVPKGRDIPVRLTGQPLGGAPRDAITVVKELPGTALSTAGGVAEMLFAVDLPDDLRGRPITWTATVSGDAAPLQENNTLAETFGPCP